MPISKYKSCPFCGVVGNIDISFTAEFQDVRATIKCETCGDSVTTTGNAALVFAIKRWNNKEDKVHIQNIPTGEKEKIMECKNLSVSDIQEIAISLLHEYYFYGCYKNKNGQIVSSFLSGIRKTVNDEIEIQLGREEWISPNALERIWKPYS